MYSVKQAAQAAGVSADTVRYYDKSGLLVGVDRDGAGSRLFDDEALGWLRVVVALRESGLPMAEVRRFAALVREGDATAAERAGILARQRERLQDKAAFLQDCIGLLDAMRGRLAP